MIHEADELLVLKQGIALFDPEWHIALGNCHDQDSESLFGKEMSFVEIGL